jgi:DNA-directed RNA polymerase subunit RPC12/RpoP
MAAETATLRCPACESDHIAWRGVENDHCQSESSDSVPSPASVIHLWECIRCGENFKQRLE